MDIPRMYRETFNAKVFLNDYYTFEKLGGRMVHQLVFFHESFQKIQSGVEVLEYGTGPSILSSISAATKASRIILAEHVEDNRKALSEWLNGDENAFNWDDVFAYVTKNLEGRSDEEIEARKLAVRNRVEAVVECDVTGECLIHPDYNKKYDVVITSLVAEAVATNLDEVKVYLKRITSFVRTKGTLLYYGLENRQGHYIVNNEKFPNVTVKSEFIMSALKEFGFTDLDLGEYEPSDDPHRVFRWIYGTRF